MQSAQKKPQMRSTLIQKDEETRNPRITSRVYCGDFLKVKLTAERSLPLWLTGQSLKRVVDDSKSVGRSGRQPQTSHSHQEEILESVPSRSSLPWMPSSESELPPSSESEDDEDNEEDAPSESEEDSASSSSELPPPLLLLPSSPLSTSISMNSTEEDLENFLEDADDDAAAELDD